MEFIHIALIEDDPVIRESLATYLGAHPAIEISVVADSVEHFLEQVSFLLLVRTHSPSNSL
jgi:DNA-binding NarL/FixJ family response regulator